MNCKDIQKRIDIAFGRGEPELSHDLKAHVESCPNCKPYFEELVRLNQILAKSHVKMRPGELDDLTFERIVGLASTKEKKAGVVADIFKIKWARKSRVLTTWIPAAAAAIIIGVLFMPQVINKPIPTTVAVSTTDFSTSDANLETALLSSDTLTNQFLSTIAGNSNEYDQADEVLLSGANINDMINGLSDNELQALYKKLDNLKG